jgi:hypothetical protein
MKGKDSVLYMSSAWRFGNRLSRVPGQALDPRGSDWYHSNNPALAFRDNS